MATILKTAFITGAGSGIGKALAQVLARRGTVVFATDINADSLQKLEDGLLNAGATIHTAQLDVADKRAVFEMAQKANEALGEIDIVFNNAGVSLSDTVEQMTYDDFEWLMDINFWGVVHGTKAFLPKMLARGKGHIVNISSLFGLVGVPAQAAYCAAKHAVKGFNESLYYELHGTGVQLHSVHPGGVDTNIVVNGVQKNNVAGRIDMKKMQRGFKKLAVTTPDEAANIILKGVDNGVYRILVGPDARRADMVSRWLPRFWLRQFGKSMHASGRKSF